MNKTLLQIFTWWNGSTIGTRFHTWRFGKEVGRDELGNVYYQGGTDSEGRTRRWVMFNGPAEASSISASWHGWMHHRTDVAPTDESYQARDWQKAHRPNMTGTAQAYRPKGSILNQGARPRVTGDYDAWTPKS